MEHLATGYHDPDPEVLGRCLRAARWLTLDERGRLWASGRYYPRVEVPPLVSRRAVVEEAHAAMGYPQGYRLYQMLRGRYYWVGMHRDCVQVASACLANQVERTRFGRPRYLFPTQKGAAPLRIYALDSMT